MDEHKKPDKSVLSSFSTKELEEELNRRKVQDAVAILNTLNERQMSQVMCACKYDIDWCTYFPNE